MAPTKVVVDPITRTKVIAYRSARGKRPHRERVGDFHTVPGTSSLCRDAIRATRGPRQRICGMHRGARHRSVRAVEDALGIDIPPNAIRSAPDDREPYVRIT